MDGVFVTQTSKLTFHHRKLVYMTFVEYENDTKVWCDLLQLPIREN